MVYHGRMTGEAYPFAATLPEVEAVEEVNYGDLLDRYGLGPEELDTEVSFGEYSGTLAEAVSDERCPVGGMLEKAYAEGGLEAIGRKLGAFSMLDEGFQVQIGDRTRAYHRGEVARDEFLPPAGQSTDFLA